MNRCTPVQVAQLDRAEGNQILASVLEAVVLEGYDRQPFREVHDFAVGPGAGLAVQQAQEVADQAVEISAQNYGLGCHLRRLTV